MDSNSKDNQDPPENNDESRSESSTHEAGTGLFGETVKKIISVGLGAAFMTEESVRTYLGDIKLPKEVLNGLLQSAAKSKTDLMNRVGNEVIRMVSKIDIVKEASRFVEEHKFRVQAEVEVIRKERPAESRSSTGRSEEEDSTAPQS